MKKISKIKFFGIWVAVLMVLLSIAPIVNANQPPYTPGYPNPADSETNVYINTSLSWTGGDPDPGDTVTYDVYFGNTSFPPKVVSNQTETTYYRGTMNYETKYYWKIIAWDNHNASQEGSIWNFTTEDPPNNPPYTPSNPNPANGSTGIDIDNDLSWTGGDPDPGDTVTYDVYFEADDPTPDVLVSDDQTNTSYEPGTLNYSTQYYWKIVAKDNHVATTEGPIWDFTTEAENIPPVANAGDDQNVTDINGNGVETVTLNGNSSYDPDGTIIAYEWKEGEAVLGTTSIITPDLSIGTHVINLTVTDNDNATDIDTVTVIVEPGTIHVENIDMALEKSAPNYRAEATVLIYDQDNNAKEGATVTGDWYLNEDLILTGASDVTDATGNAYIYSPWKKAKKGNTFTFVVTNVELDYYVYNVSANVETEDSITI